MRIVAAIDSSPTGEHVLETIGPWAAAIGAEVDIISLIDSRQSHDTVASKAPVMTTPLITWNGISLPVGLRYPSTVESHGEALERTRHQRAEHLAMACSRFLQGVPATVHVDYAGDVATAICEYAVERGAACIAMGTRARPTFKAAVFGSVSEAVIHHSPVPVLVVRGDMVARTAGNRAVTESASAPV